MNQKAQQKLQSHHDIIASAAALLRERGIQASSVIDVMRGAGLTVGGFYGHFDSKEQLFVQTIKSAASTMWNQLLHSAKGDSPRDRALSFLNRYLSRRHRDNPEGGCLLPSAAPEVARAGEPYRSALQTELAGFADSFAALLGTGADPADRPDRADRADRPGLREEALGLIALMYGALSLSRAVSGTRLSDEFLQAAKALGERILTVEKQ